MVARWHSAARSMFWWMMLSVPIVTQGACPNMSAVTTGSSIEVPGISVPLEMELKSPTGNSTIGTMKLKVAFFVEYELSNSQGKIGSLQESFNWPAKDIHMFDCDKKKFAEMKVKHKDFGQLFAADKNIKWFDIFDGQGAKVAVLDFDPREPAYYKLKLPDGTNFLKINLEYKNWFHLMIFASASFDKATLKFYTLPFNATVPPLLKEPKFLNLLAGYTMATQTGLLSYIIFYPLMVCCCCCCCYMCCCGSSKKNAVAQEEVQAGQVVSKGEGDALLANQEQAAVEPASGTSKGSLFNCCSRGSPQPQGNMQS